MGATMSMGCQGSAFFELEKEVDVATIARHAAEVASILVECVVAGRSLELLAEAPTKRGAEYTAAEYLSSALA